MDEATRNAIQNTTQAARQRLEQAYFDSLFDELSRDLKVLFDRHEASSLLWPDRQTLIELLGILNAPALAEVWCEDETIGWVYQYWNSKEERKAMREASAAPRNSREQIDALIAERSSNAVKAALQDLLDAPTAGGSTRRKTRSKA